MVVILHTAIGETSVIAQQYKWLFRKRGFLNVVIVSAVFFRVFSFYHGAKRVLSLVKFVGGNLRNPIDIGVSL
jgi:hypothetical protein